eukprot:g977.t1
MEFQLLDSYVKQTQVSLEELNQLLNELNEIEDNARASGVLDQAEEQIQIYNEAVKNARLEYHQIPGGPARKNKWKVIDSYVKRFRGLNQRYKQLRKEHDKRALNTKGGRMNQRDRNYRKIVDASKRVEEADKQALLSYDELLKQKETINNYENKVMSKIDRSDGTIDKRDVCKSLCRCVVNAVDEEDKEDLSVLRHLKKILSADGVSPNPDSSKEIGPLYLAAKLNLESAAKILLNHGASMVAESNGETPLEVAIRLKNRDVLNLFLRKIGGYEKDSPVGEDVVAIDFPNLDDVEEEEEEEEKVDDESQQTVSKSAQLTRLRAKILYKENVIQEYKRKCGQEMWDFLVAQDSGGAERIFRKFYGKVEEVKMNIRTLQDEIVRLENHKKSDQS